MAHEIGLTSKLMKEDFELYICFGLWIISKGSITGSRKFNLTCSSGSSWKRNKQIKTGTAE